VYEDSILMSREESIQVNRALEKWLFNGYDFLQMDKSSLAASIERIAIMLYLGKTHKYLLQPFEFQKFGIKSFH
jgi:hypothetical protein